MPRNIPGTPMLFGPKRLASFLTNTLPSSPFVNSNISSRAADGARLSKLIDVYLSDSLEYATRLPPYPPILVLAGSTTQTARPAAIAASKALPPFLRYHDSCIGCLWVRRDYHSIVFHGRHQKF